MIEGVGLSKHTTEEPPVWERVSGEEQEVPVSDQSGADTPKTGPFSGSWFRKEKSPVPKLGFDQRNIAPKYKFNLVEDVIKENISELEQDRVESDSSTLLRNRLFSYATQLKSLAYRGTCQASSLAFRHTILSVALCTLAICAWVYCVLQDTLHRQQVEEAYLTSCVAGVNESYAPNPNHPVFDDFRTYSFEAPREDESNLNAVISSTCSGALLLKDLFVQKMREAFAGEYELEPIGEGVTHSNFLVSEGRRIAVLKSIGADYNMLSTPNWECFVREILGQAGQDLVPGLAQVALDGKNFMAVEYLESLPVSKIYTNIFERVGINPIVTKYLEIPSFLASLQVIWLLDTIFSNDDRNLGNLLITCAGFKAIDHDYLLQASFNPMVDVSYHRYKSLGLFQHPNLTPRALEFINSLTPELIKRLGRKYRRQINRHFFSLSDPRGFYYDHVKDFVNKTTRVIKFVKLFAEERVPVAAIDAFVRNVERPHI